MNLPQMIEVTDPYNATYRIPIHMLESFEYYKSAVILTANDPEEGTWVWSNFFDLFGGYVLYD